MTRTESMSAEMREHIIRRSYPAHAGHIGSCMSIVDLVAVLLGRVMRRGVVDEDRLVLSKGHAALALYAGLHCIGAITGEQLESYCHDGSEFGEHPDHVAPGVEFSTGSLGIGLSLGTGLALSAKLRGTAQRTFVIMSDAELNEGSIWEAAMFAAHHGLANLCLLVDLNGQQALGETSEILGLPQLADRWRAFGWDAHEVDGHDHEALAAALSDKKSANAPHVLLAKTIFAKGVPYMEGKLGWHYWSMNDEQYAKALEELGVEVEE